MFLTPLAHKGSFIPRVLVLAFAAMLCINGLGFVLGGTHAKDLALQTHHNDSSADDYGREKRGADNFPGANKSLESLVNEDGAMNLATGFSGSLDISGWRMEYASDGSPRFVKTEQKSPTVAGDERWDPQFGLRGLNGGVAAVALVGGDLYVGGFFLDAGGDPNADHIAKWNGSSWSALGTGISGGGVLSLAVVGSDLYVGGSIFGAGGVAGTNGIAKWNGSTWSALGTDFFGTVSALAVSGSDLYVGGSVFLAGDPNVRGIAKWNGTSWSALGTGLSNTVSAIAVSGSDVYAGGSFLDAGGDLNADRIAKWNGSSWSALGTGLSSTVRAIAVSGSDIYAGGDFTDAGGDPNADRIAKWNGTSWSGLGSGLSNTVSAIAVSGSDVYVGGSFLDAGGVAPADFIARWNGVSWSALGNGLSGGAVALVISGSDIYVGGSFASADGAQVGRVAKWDGGSWSAVDSSVLVSPANGLNNHVEDIAVSGNDVYVGGSFLDAGGNPNADNIAKWDGTNWSPLGNGLNANVNAIVVIGGDIYVGGNFTDAGGDPNADRIAKWNGTSWSALGSGLSSGVESLAVSGTDLYVGGRFLNAGGDPSADRIAKWNGTSWSALGSGLNSTVWAIKVNGSDVYAGGQFTNAGGDVNANGIAKWNGSSWSALGNGLGTVIAIVAIGSDLYAGGEFTDAGGDPNADGIAKWNGSNWSSLGSGLGLNGSVYYLAVSGSDLYVGGFFTDAGGTPNADCIAKWNGTSWSNLGSGTGETVWAVAVTSNDLFIGGDFGAAGGKLSYCFGRYLLNAPVWAGGTNTDWHNGTNWSSGSVPSPTSDVILPSNGVSNEVVISASDVTIEDLFIQSGRTLTVAAGRTLTVNGNLISSGTIGGGGTIVFNGASFVNNGSINNVNVQFGAGLHQLSGTGSFLGNTVSVLSGSTLQLSSNHTMNRIVVDSGGMLDIPSGQTLALSGAGVALTNNGSGTGAGTILFNGTSAQSTSGSATFGSLTINNAAGVTLGGSSTVNGTLSLTSGDLNTGAFTLTMPATATSTGTTDVVGNVNRTGFTTANTFSFGNPFNTIHFTSGIPPTDVTVNLLKQTPDDFGNAALRTYTITPNGGSGFAATLRLHYLDSELNGNSEATLVLWRKDASWTNLGATAMNAMDNWVELAGVGQFSPWVISGPSSPCGFNVSSTSRSFAGNGGNGTVNITASDAGCAWAASTTASFVHITSGGSGLGNGLVQYSVDANPGSTIRSDTITIAGHTFTVYQGINFADVQPDALFYNEIGKLAARGVTLGCGGGNYCPNDPVLRDQMAAFIMRAKGEPNPPTPGSQRFVDVPPANPFYNFIDRLAELQITLGCSPTMYCPSDPVRREQMAAFLIRGLGEFNPPTPAMQRFTDVPPENPFYKFIDRMAVLQITLGCSPTMYCPNDIVTRGQMAAFLVRAFNL